MKHNDKTCPNTGQEYKTIYIDDSGDECCDQCGIGPWINKTKTIFPDERRWL